MQRALLILMLVVNTPLGADWVISVPPQPSLPEPPAWVGRLPKDQKAARSLLGRVEAAMAMVADRLTDKAVVAALAEAEKVVSTGGAAVVVTVADVYTLAGVTSLDDVRSGRGSDPVAAMKALLGTPRLLPGLGPTNAHTYTPRLYVTKMIGGNVVTYQPFTDPAGLLRGTHEQMKAAASAHVAELKAAEAARKSEKPSSTGGGDREPRTGERPWQTYGRDPNPGASATADSKDPKTDTKDPKETKETKPPEKKETDKPQESIPIGGGTGLKLVVDGQETPEKILREAYQGDVEAARRSIISRLQVLSPWGIDGTRSWLDVDFDRRADFCRSAWSGWIEAPLTEWEQWAWVPAGEPYAHEDLAPAAVPRRRYVQVYLCSVTLNKDRRATDGEVVLVPLIDFMMPTSTNWVAADRGVMVCRDFATSGGTLTRCNNLRFSAGKFTFGGTEELSVPMEAENAVWVDRNGDGLADRCWITVTGADQDGAVAMAAGSAQQMRAFLALEAGKPRKGFVRCIEHAMVSGWNAVVTSPLTYVGHADLRYWGDINGDQREDFCRVVDPARTVLLCSESREGGDAYVLDLLENPGS